MHAGGDAIVGQRFIRDFRTTLKSDPLPVATWKRQQLPPTSTTKAAVNTMVDDPLKGAIIKDSFLKIHYDRESAVGDAVIAIKT